MPIFQKTDPSACSLIEEIVTSIVGNKKDILDEKIIDITSPID